MIVLFLADGFEEAEAVCPVDILRRAGLDVKTVSITDRRTVCSTRNIRIEADLTANELKGTPEAVILPGGMPGAENLMNSPLVIGALRKCAENGGYVAAICAAPIALAKAGLLEGREAICYPGFEKMLSGASVVKRAVVVDGKVVTAIGPGAAFEFGLTLAGLLAGQEQAKKIGRSMLPV